MGARRERVVAAAAASTLVAAVAAVAALAAAPGSPARPAVQPLAARPAAVAAPASRSAPPSSPPPATRRAKPAVRAAYPFPLPAPPVAPQPCPPPPRPPSPPGPPLGPPVVPEAHVPAPLPLLARSVRLAPVAGKGIWLTTWPGQLPDVAQVIARARAAGLRSLWVRTGSTKDGFYGAALLDRLLPAAHAAGLAVVAWDFPDLSDPSADALRARSALGLRVAGQHLDGFAPDIETVGERVHLSARRVARYLSLVRRYAGNRPVVATVPAPVRSNLRSYPYGAEAPYVDAYAPMVYWSCAEPGAAAERAVAALRRWRPVTAVGQSYDMGPEGGRVGVPGGAEIWRFLDAAHRAGAIGATLYLYEQTGPAQWRALAGYPW